jgi:hypothetical protein
MLCGLGVLVLGLVVSNVFSVAGFWRLFAIRKWRMPENDNQGQ